MSNLLSQWLKRKEVDNDHVDNNKKIKNENKTNITPSPSASSSTSNNPVTSLSSVNITYNLDIANFLKGSNITITDHDRAVLITTSNIPNIDFVYPFSVHSKKGKEEKRYLNKSYFEKYKWLTYSKNMSGLFCKYCVLFSDKGGRYKTIKLCKFVSQPLQKYAKLLGKDGDLEVHSRNHYHVTCVQISDSFLTTFNNPKKEVINLINTERMKQVEENRNRLKPIVESIIFLGRQNIPFRGHRDHGNFFENDVEKNSIVNKGNFRELLHYRINSGDSILESHLKTTHSKATYISPVVQNELIDCCRIIITEIILKEIKESIFYSVIFDETTDISHSSQMSLVLRYIHKGVVKENFVAFIDCHTYVYNKNTTNEKDKNENNDDTLQNNVDLEQLEPKLNGEILGETVISLLQNIDLDLKYCVGIGTDGCSVMVSLVRGAVQKIQSYAKNAIHCPCANHALNLSLSKSSSVQSIRNSVGLMKEVIEFFNCSSKRNFVLKTVLNGQPRLQSLCETRWIERHDSVMLFKKSLPFTIDALTKISEWNEFVSSSKAKILLIALCNCEFIIAVQCLSNILCVTAPISRILQGMNNDVLCAKNCIGDVITNLENKRTNCQSIFEEIFKECEELMSEMDIEVKVPRLSKKQTNRPNHPAKTTEEYYRVSIYVPLLDSIIVDLKSRFLSKENKLLLNLCLLIPRYIVDITGEDLKKIIEAATKLYNFNETELIDKLELQTELELWKTKWQCLKNEGNININF